jgi:hypothetical protein
MKLHYRFTIIFLLCLCVIGFFANFAQNDYGLKLSAISLMGVAGVLAINAWHSVKTFKMVYGIALSIPFVSLIGIVSPVSLIVPLLISLLLLIILLPVATFFKERKTETQSALGDYYEYLFIIFLLAGMFYKMFYLPGAGPMIILSVLILLLYVVRFVRNASWFKSSDGLSKILFHLSLGILVCGIAFKQQHWPGANDLFAWSRIVFLLFILAAVWMVFKEKKQLRTVFSPLHTILFWCMGIILLHGVLRKAEWVPAFYNNQMPSAYYEIDSKANPITAEGRLFEERKQQYLNYYEELTQTIQEND